MTIALPWFAWVFAGRRGYRALGSVLVASAVGISGVAIYNTTQGGGGMVPAAFSGTFDCYGSTPNCPTQAPLSCSSTISSGLQTALNNATGGEVICLSSASSYGNITLSSKTYSSAVTVQPASGVAATVGALTLDTVAKLRFTGIGGGSASMSMNGFAIDTVSGCSTNITLDRINFSDGGLIEPKYACGHNLNILIDHDRFDNLGQSTFEGRLSINSFSGQGAPAVGITVSNSHFGGSGTGSQCSDGIYMGGDVYGAVIGPGNEFTGIDQSGGDGDCFGSHVDNIQSNSSEHTTVTGNYFHDNGTGTGGFSCFASFDCQNATITNNVFGGSTYSGANVVVSDNALVSHNAFVDTGGGGGTGDIRVYTEGSTSLLTNNSSPVGGFYTGDASCCTHSYNLNDSGTGNVSGAPVYVSSPASGYYHWQLDSTSPGYHAASDGKSMGITP